jgi:c-di-GMP phosphodiesterase
MQCYSLIYRDIQTLNEFVVQNNLQAQGNILIQVFTGINEYTYIENLRQTVLTLLPQAKIIGATTSGEISNHQTTTQESVLTFCLFENTKICTHLIDTYQSSFDLGTTMMQTIHKKKYNDLKVIISFTDGLHTNGEEYLKGLTSIDDSIVIAGGMAGDNSLFQNTYIFNEHTITNKGAVAVSLYNAKLHVHTDYNFSWQSLGKSHTVQKSEKNRVYTIDDKTAVEFYAYYLGENIASMLPAIGVEFPLVIKKDGLDIARAVLNKYDDGSLGFAGNVPQGSQIKFGYGDIQMILTHGLHKAKQLAQKPIEAIFIYSCMARKALLKEEINNEIKPLQEIAPASGFFTYGEFFYTQNKARLLNQTMTILALSESPTPTHYHIQKELDIQLESVKKLDFYRTQALSKLIAKTTNELEELNATLEKRVKEEVEKSLEKDAILFANARHAQMGEILDMIVHQWRQPLNVFSAGVSSLQIYKSMNVLTDDIFDKTTHQILSNVEFLNNTIKDFRSFFKDSQLKEHTSIHTVVDKSLVLLEALIKKFGVKLIQEITFNKELYICVGELIQVILNIVKNSIDAIEEKGIKHPEIYFKIYEQKHACIIEISDNAGGIPEHILPRIFDKRFTTKGESHGTGIGLDMSKTIIQNHFKGTITAKNNSHGATFTIAFPLHIKEKR